MNDPAIARRVAALVDRVDELQEENRQLRELLNPPTTLPPHWRLTRQQAQVVGALARGRGRSLTTEYLLGVMYGPGHDRAGNALHVAVMKIRRGKAIHGLTIENQWGGLFSMPLESCAIVQAALAGHDATSEKMGVEMGSKAPIGPRAAPVRPAA